MRADFKICLDSCVLANYRLCDFLLRLAEKPRLFSPIWSEEILAEVHRTQTGKLGWPQHLAESFQTALREHFPEAFVHDYAHLIAQLENDEKDRHVLAAAIRAGASLIVTFNRKDFPPEALDPWNIQATHPQEYLLVLYEIDPHQVVQRIAQISGARGESQIDTLIQLGRHCPEFARRLIDDLDLA